MAGDPQDQIKDYLRRTPWLRDVAVRLIMLAAALAGRVGPVGHHVADLAERAGLALAGRATEYADDLRVSEVSRPMPGSSGRGWSGPV